MHFHNYLFFSKIEQMILLLYIAGNHTMFYKSLKAKLEKYEIVFIVT